MLSKNESEDDQKPDSLALKETRQTNSDVLVDGLLQKPLIIGILFFSFSFCNYTHFLIS